MRRLGLLGSAWALGAGTAAAAILALTWGAGRLYERYAIDSLTGQLKAQARLLERQVLRTLALEPGRERSLFCLDLGEPSELYISILDAGGRIVCETPALLAPGTDLRDRTEVAAALEGQIVAERRFNVLLKKEFLFVAVPFHKEGKVAAIVRTGADLTSLGAVSGELGTLALAVALGAVVAAGLLARRHAFRVREPLARIRDIARHYGEGNLEGRLPISGVPELRELAGTINEMAARLETRLKEILARRNEQEAVFLSMIEAVIAVDRDRNVINLNREAGQLFSIDLAEARGRSLLEVIRNPDLQRFMNATLASEAPTEREIELDDAQRILSAHGTALRDAEGRRIGALMVLNDVTRLRRLENLRRDFVANVSHELKTPITSIKGFVETLIDGAVRDPSAADRFLRIISRQADRLSAIIEDLLQLSRIERETERQEVELRPNHLLAVLRAAVELCQPQAEEKGMLIELDCPQDLMAAVNPPLLESALVNLIDNALKYGESGGRVRVALKEIGREVVISVQDWGPGIARNHLPRLFERFYRVDQSRDRKAGGSGLGLSIVKHIAQAHGGRVAVESEVGAGSTFSLSIPRI
jgi:two-component system phosphate regulon sensor histidine kinase PhoR